MVTMEFTENPFFGVSTSIDDHIVIMPSLV